MKMIVYLAGGSAQGWEIASLAPTFEPDPKNELAEFEKDSSKDWYETRMMVSTEGTIYTVSGTGIGPERERLRTA